MRSGTEGTGSWREAKEEEEEGEGMKMGMVGGNSCWLQRYLYGTALYGAPSSGVSEGVA